MEYKLIKEIISLSQSQYWDDAKLEWNFEYVYQSDEHQTCLCGHYPIRNICVLGNKLNNVQTEVGNCCVNKFLGIDDGNKIFISITRLKGDLSKSMSAEVVEYLRKKNILNEVEYGFYTNKLKARNLTLKQLNFKKKINQKFLDFTSGESSSNLSKINIILKWSENNSFFDTGTILSFKGHFERFGKLTENQEKALDNIISKFKIV